MAKLPISWSTIQFSFSDPLWYFWHLQSLEVCNHLIVLVLQAQFSAAARLSSVARKHRVFVASLHCFYGQINKADNLHYKILHSSFKDTGKLLGCKHGFNLYYMTCNSSCKFPSLFGSNSSQQCGGEWATWEREDKGAMLVLKAELLQILLKKGEINDFFPLFQDFLTDQIVKIR